MKNIGLNIRKSHPDRTESQELGSNQSKLCHRGDENGVSSNQVLMRRKARGATLTSSDTPKVSRSASFHSSTGETAHQDFDPGLQRLSTPFQSWTQPYSNEGQPSIQASQNRSELSTNKLGGEQTDSNQVQRNHRRRKNTESVRRSRERKRTELEQLERVYDANEARIKELEKMADELSRELRRTSTISGINTHQTRPGHRFRRDKPKWFGTPF